MNRQFLRKVFRRNESMEWEEIDPMDVKKGDIIKAEPSSPYEVWPVRATSDSRLIGIDPMSSVPGFEFEELMDDE